MPSKKSVWIAGIARGHNGGVCLLKDGEIVFSIEEERLTRQKYDGGPYASMIKILEYTDKLDFLVVAHTQNLEQTAGKVDFSGDDVYTGLARKLGLIKREAYQGGNHPLLFGKQKVFTIATIQITLKHYTNTLVLMDLLWVHGCLNFQVKCMTKIRIKHTN